MKTAPIFGTFQGNFQRPSLIFDFGGVAGWRWTNLKTQLKYSCPTCWENKVSNDVRKNLPRNDNSTRLPAIICLGKTRSELFNLGGGARSRVPLPLRDRLSGFCLSGQLNFRLHELCRVYSHANWRSNFIFISIVSFVFVDVIVPLCVATDSNAT